MALVIVRVPHCTCKHLGFPAPFNNHTLHPGNVREKSGGRDREGQTSQREEGCPSPASPGPSQSSSTQLGCSRPGCLDIKWGQGNQSSREPQRSQCAHSHSFCFGVPLGPSGLPSTKLIPTSQSRNTKAPPAQSPSAVARPLSPGCRPQVYHDGVDSQLSSFPAPEPHPPTWAFSIGYIHSSVTSAPQERVQGIEGATTARLRPPLPDELDRGVREPCGSGCWGG